jgi:predicted transcriptional regulator
MKKQKGAPTKFHDSKKNALERALSGQTDKEIATGLGLTERTILNWKKKYPDFFHALKEARTFTDDLAEGSLLKLALGYEKEEVKVFLDRSGQVVEHRYKIEVPPNITALIFWLKNRRPVEWRDKLEEKLGESLADLILQTQIKKEAILNDNSTDSGKVEK